MPDPWEMDWGAAAPATAQAAANPMPWEMDWGPSATKDVAKSAGVGLGKGTIGLAGLPGDVSGAIGKGADWIAGKLGEDPAKIAADRAKVDNTNLNILPTSDSLTKHVEDVTGKFYEPQTRAGKYAEKAAEFVPGAVVGGGAGVVKNIVRYGVLPGLASEAAGEATEGTSLETPARLGAAVATGGVGGIVSRPATAERALASKLPDFVEPAHIDQAEQLIHDAASRGVTLTWPEALSQVTGKPVLTDTQRVLESAPQSRPAMQETLGSRPEQIDNAARSEIDNIAPGTAQPSTIGPAVGKAAEDTLTDARTVINNATKPYYDRAEKVLLNSAEMAKVRALPGYEEAKKAIIDDPQLKRYVAGLPENSVAFLNEVKKYFDQQGKNAARPLAQSPNMQRAAGYSKDAAAAAKIGTDNSLDYATALALQSHARETFLQPLLKGPLGTLAKKDISTKNAIDALFPAAPLAGSEKEVSTAVSDLARRNPRAAQELVRAHVEQKLDEAFNAAGRGQEAAQFAGAGFASRVSGSPVITTQRLENLRAAVEALPNGKNTWAGLDKFLEIARATGTRQPIGSKTAFNEQELHQMQTGTLAGNIVKEGASPERWINMVHDYWGRWQLGKNLNQLASIITDPKAAPIFKRLSKIPTGDREGKFLAARVIAISLAGQDRAQATPARK